MTHPDGIPPNTAPVLLVYAGRENEALRTLELGDAPIIAPLCDWCASKPANVELDASPYCRTCLGELVDRGRLARPPANRRR